MQSADSSIPAHFIRQIIANDLKAKKHNGCVVTRFPPEPNGYLHIGHAKSICLNFGMALENNGTCHLRFDDTNPEKESVEYMESIKRDVAWLGFEWAALCHASDYFEQLYSYAVTLIKKGLAYVDSLSADEIRAYRGTLTEPVSMSCVLKLTWRRLISICAIQQFIVFVACIISKRAIHGVFTLCMITRIVYLMLSRGLRILFVHWNLKIIVLFMIGCLINCKRHVILSK